MVIAFGVELNGR